MWNSFCWNNGLAPSGTPIKDKSFSIKSVEATKTISLVKSGSPTTVHSTVVIAVPTVPVFEISTDFGNNPDNDGLDTNACRPQAGPIVDSDLGFCLRTDDPYYTANDRQPQYDYSQEPESSLVSSARDNLPTKAHNRRGVNFLG